MQIFLNNEELKFTLEGEKNFGEVWENLLKFFIDNDIIVNEIQIDGGKVATNEVKNYYENGLSEIKRVDVGVNIFSNLMADSLKVLKSVVEMLKAETVTAKEMIETSEEIKLIEVMEHLSNTLFNYRKMINGINVLYFIYRKKELKIGANFNEIMDSLEDAIKHKDTAKIKDIMYFKIEESITKLGNQINDIEQQNFSK